jgi:hypothetical protein
MLNTKFAKMSMNVNIPINENKSILENMEVSKLMVESLIIS